MIIPYGDINPRRTIPYINYAIIAANIAVFVLMFSREPWEIAALFQTYALVPADFDVRTMFTSMWLHAGVAHLFGNMLYLWIAGDNVEDRYGHLVYLVFYICAGLVAGAAHVLTTTGKAMFLPTVGASGAVSGVIGAYLVLFPHSRIRMLLLLPLAAFTVPSWVAILTWFALQLLPVLSDRHLFGGVAYWAHIGGFGFGVGVTFLLKVLGLTETRRYDN